jgi:hypothetical protein
MVVFLAGTPMERRVNVSDFDSLESCEKVSTRISNAMSANEADTKYYYCHEVPEPDSFVCGSRLFWGRDCYGYRLTK